ncbi:formate dehydrogenase accessory sulfurtransferase FdhD [Heliobacterium gestii]|uniref:Sulfur carrier protein FdhD n=2 Tax=Heliomicrobium gestii TaxID=2699 RepID=A0A845L5A1_HELGE|nr:formate dehydrogenase accessory sulfurtransferase FdhD [Heliomicrobium gestii]
MALRITASERTTSGIADFGESGQEQKGQPQEAAEREWNCEQAEREEMLVREWPLTLYLNGEELVTLLASPEHIEDLAVGFLTAEGFLQRPGQVKSLRGDYENGQVFVEADTALSAGNTFMRRYITTGCGKGVTFYDVTDARHARNLDGVGKAIAADQLLARMADMQSRSGLYRETGGVHSAALCESDGLLLYREDIGRHNAADKIAGACFRDNIATADTFFLTSGRISSEILLKVAKMGIPLIASRSAPTDLAVQLGEQLGMTVVGFVRGKRMNVYSHPWRIAR